MNQNKTWRKKILTGLLFIMSLFVTAVVLVFIGIGDGPENPTGALIPVVISGFLMLLSAYLFLNAIFEEKADEISKLKEEAEKELEEDIFRQEMKEYIGSVDRTQKAVFSVMKRREDATEEQISRLEKAIERMAEQQMADHKALVKYNKENARQMAINERETLEHVKDEILKELKNNKNAEVAVAKQEESVPEMFEMPEEEIALDFEIPDFVLPEETEPAPMATEDTSTDNFGALSGVDLSDPNATLTPEDIAKLFAAAGN